MFKIPNICFGHWNFGNWNLFVICILLFVICFLSSCSIKKQLTIPPTQTISAMSLDAKIKSNRLDFEWFAARVKIDLLNKATDKNFTANIRMQRDTLIWISLSAALGYEAARLLITPDSVKLIDRWHKKYYQKELGFLKDYLLLLHIDFQLIQQFIIGEVIFYNDEKLSMEKQENGYLLISQRDNIKNYISFSSQDWNIRQIHVIDQNNNQSILIKYDEYTAVKDKLFAFKRQVQLIKNGTTNIEIHFSKIKVDERLSFPFAIPDKYEQVH